MPLLQIICWLVVVFAFFGKWSDEHYLANSLIYIASVIILYLSYK